MLNRLEWRGKAQYVVNAFLCYLSRGDLPEARSPAPDEKHIEAVVNRILQGRNNSGAGVIPVSAPAGHADEPSPSALAFTDDLVYDDAVEALGEDGYNAIAGALDMFRRK